MSKTISIGDIEVPRIGFGTLYLCVERGFGPTHVGAIPLLQEAANLGVRFFDTADSYGNGSAEEAVKTALFPYDGLLIATKGGYRHDRLGAWIPDATPERLVTAIEGSLRRLNLETIDLYQLHCQDRRVPYAEQVGALARLQQAGKIRHIGISNVGVAQIEMAQREVEVVSLQNPYNIRSGWHDEVIEYCTDHGICFIPWMPLGDGRISWTDPVLMRIAETHDAHPAQVALSALLHRSPVITPIPGTSSIDHLHKNFEAAELILNEAELSEIWPDR